MTNYVYHVIMYTWWLNITNNFRKGYVIMAYKDSRDFRSDYPKGYSRNGDVYDGNGHKIGYVTGDGDYRINDGSANDRQLYHNGGDDDDD